jgi:peptidoglycan/xylan/chitin deacetylase (PgdA/CDA1 family)
MNRFRRNWASGPGGIGDITPGGLSMGEQDIRCHNRSGYSVKTLFLGACKTMQVFSAVRGSRWRSQRLLILAYHGISLRDEHAWDKELYMPEHLFRQRMQSLRSYSVLPLEEAVARLYSGDLPPRAVALTFDDGLHDFRVRACPILAEFGYPATIYLTTYFSVHRYPVFNLFFSYLLWKGRGKTIDLSTIVPGLGHHSLAADRPMILQQIREYRKKEHLDNEALVKMARSLAAAVHEDYDRLCELGILHLMSPAQVSELPRFGVNVQLHTHRHRAPDDEALFRREISDNRKCIAAMGIPAEKLRHFCYPDGKYRTSFLAWLRNEDVQTATTCDAGLASRRSSPLLLPRLIDTCNISPLEFEGWLTGTSLLARRSTG